MASTSAAEGADELAGMAEESVEEAVRYVNSTQLNSTDAGVQHLDVRIYVVTNI